METFKQKVIQHFVSSRFVFNVLALGAAVAITVTRTWTQEAMYVVGAIVLGYNGNKGIEHWPKKPGTPEQPK